MRFLLALSFIVLCVSFWKRNDFPDDIPLQPQLTQEPRQTAVNRASFQTEFNDVQYEISPLYEYELYGLVVSYRHHDGDAMLHESWNDHLNMADLCVVWQDSASTPFLNKLTFWNGQFTCNVSAPDQQSWASFNMHQLSNNHLISDRPEIRKQIEDVSIGDQIYIKGWLSSYKNEFGNSRGTSTRRDDGGNGACETIYVSEFQILRSMENGWQRIMYMSLVAFLILIGVYFFTPRRN